MRLSRKTNVTRNADCYVIVLVDVQRVRDDMRCLMSHISEEDTTALEGVVGSIESETD
jgi:hypothetical protein